MAFIFEYMPNGSLHKKLHKVICVVSEYFIAGVFTEGKKYILDLDSATLYTS